MLAMLRPVQPYLEYALNQDYIAEFLCVNKDKPQLQCNGKCHLAKQIEKQQEQEPFSTLSISLENYPIGFVEILKIDASGHLDQRKKATKTPYQILYRFDYNYSAFQPPDTV